MPRFLRADGTSYWPEVTEQDEAIIEDACCASPYAVPPLPERPRDAAHRDRMRVAWAAPGGDLQFVLAETHAPAIRAHLRESLRHFCRRLSQDRRADVVTRDLIREYLLGSD